MLPSGNRVSMWGHSPDRQRRRSGTFAVITNRSFGIWLLGLGLDFLYVFDMRTVQQIPLILLLLVCAAGCSSSDEAEHLPLIIRDPPAAEDPAELVPALPSGYIANPEDKVFHRLDCPDAKKVKPSIRQFYVTPFDALNEGFRPCKYCEPMSGWK